MIKKQISIDICHSFAPYLDYTSQANQRSHFIQIPFHIVIQFCFIYLLIHIQDKLSHGKSAAESREILNNVNPPTSFSFPRYLSGFPLPSIFDLYIFPYWSFSPHFSLHIHVPYRTQSSLAAPAPIHFFPANSLFSLFICKLARLFMRRSPLVIVYSTLSFI